MVRQFRPSVRLSVSPSVTRVDFIKTAGHIIEILSLSDRPMILYTFRHQGLLRKSDGFTPNGSTEYNGEYSNFQPICGYTLETVIDRGVFTEEDE